jgi:hypothetical protein
MAQGLDRIGAQFDALEARNNLVPDAQMAHDITDSLRDYHNLVPESQRAPAVENILVDLAQGGPIDGARYQGVRSRLERLARGSSDPQTRHALRDIRETLDATMERSIAANNPDDLGAWREARRQYRNFLTLEDTASRAGSDAARGLLSPQNLRNSAVTKQGRRNYVTGEGDFHDLARAAAGVMEKLPNSGTAARSAARMAGGVTMSSLIGALLGHSVAPGIGEIAGGVAGSALPALAGRAILSGPARAYLGNQMLPGGPGGGEVARRAMIAALLGRQSRE